MRIQIPFYKIGILFLMNLLVHIKSVGQTILPRFDRLEVNDGLAHNSVYSIYQDKTGFMWFATPNGLNRYDGNSIQIYQYNGSEMSLANNFVRGNIVEDNDGNIWYSNESGLFRWNVMHEKVEMILNFNGSPAYNGITSIIASVHNVLWIINNTAGLMEFDIQSHKIKAHPWPKETHHYIDYDFTVYDGRKEIWIKSNSKKEFLMGFDIQAKKYNTKKFERIPNRLFFGHQGEQLLVFKNELQLHNVDGQTKIFPLDHITKSGDPVTIRHAIEDQYGRWWITTVGNGLLSLNPNTGQITQYLSNILRLKSLPFNITTLMTIDKNENLWIGSDGGGVAKLNLREPRFKLFPISVGAHPELTNYFTKCFFEDAKGRIWFGSHSDGLNIYDPISDKLINYRKTSKKGSISGNIVGAIFQDSRGQMWIGSNGGLSIFDEKTESFYNIPIYGLSEKLPFSSSLIYKIRELKNGNLMCATWLGLIEVKRIDNRYIGIARPEPYLLKNTADLIEMPGNIFFIATTSGDGLIKTRYVNNSMDSLTTFLKGLDIRSITQSRRNPQYLWVATGAGLVYFNTKTSTYEIFNESKGLPNNYTYGALEDDAENLWISTNKGLSFFDFKKNKFTNYSFYNGLQSNEFNTQAFYRGASGNFYFGGVQGFNWFKKVTPGPSDEKPSVAITQIEINGLKFMKDNKYFKNKSIDVSYDKNYFAFQIAVLDYTLPQANRIKYRMEGWETDFITTENKIARYSNLPPGNYVFRVMAVNGDDIWSDEKKVFIHIRAPFWKTPIFIFVVILLLLFIIVYITSYLSKEKAKRKMVSLEKQIAVDAERFRIGADMHDEIGSSITHIALVSELARSQSKTTEELKSEMKLISSSARNLVQSMSEIIWTLNPQNDTLDNLTAYMREQFRAYFEPFPIPFEIYFPDEIPDIKLNNEQRRNLFLVAKELLHNSLKHAQASNISISLRITQRQLIFRVVDDGIGMRKTKIKASSNGIRNLKKRMKDIGGSIEWIQLAPGTCATFSLPYK